MIHSTESDSLAGNFTFPASSGHRSSNRQTRALPRRDRWSHATYAELVQEVSAEPAFGSPWHPGLLDRLKAPLTRYHD